MHSEHTGQMRADKYLRENYYYCIKYFVTNFLTALMRKWYLNSALQLPPKTSRGCLWDYDQHKQSNVNVEGRDEKWDVV